MSRERDYILLHVFLARHNRRLSDLEAHLGRGVIYEATKASGSSSSATRGREGIAIAVELRLGLLLLILVRDWWRRRSHHGNLGNMLGSRMK